MRTLTATIPLCVLPWCARKRVFSAGLASAAQVPFAAVFTVATFVNLPSYGKGSACTSTLAPALPPVRRPVRPVALPNTIGLGVAPSVSVLGAGALTATPAFAESPSRAAASAYFLILPSNARGPRRFACGPMPTASRCLDTQSVAGLQLARRLARQLLAVQEVPARCARLTALSAGGAVAATLGDQRIAHRLQRLQFAHHAVAASIPSGPARAAAQRVLDRPQRKLELQRLHRRVQGVRHRHVHGARAVGVGARALAAAECLVVGELLVAE